MSDQQLHSLIQERLGEIYKHAGFEVQYEGLVMTPERGYYVDIIARKKGINLAIEIGRIQLSKIHALRKKGYITTTFPFNWTDFNNNHACICGHSWTSKKKLPTECPNCKQYLYFEEPQE